MTIESSADPVTGCPAASVSKTTSLELQQVLARATKAADMASSSTPAQRSAWLNAAADALDNDVDELVRLADWETALGFARLTGEVARAANQARFYASVAVEGSYLGAVIDGMPATSASLTRVNEPVGVVAVFGASNFPLAFSVFGNDTSSAIAAGCSVVVKAHPAHLALSERVFELVAAAMTRAGAPDGLIEIVYGFEAGLELVGHEDVSAVAFTGSERGGMALWRAANERSTPVPVYAEMGTVNPVVVTPAGADAINTVAKGFVESFTLGSGQFCTKPGLIFVPRSAAAPAKIAAALNDAAPQPVMLTEGIAAAVQTGVDEFIQAGATLVAQTAASGNGWSAPATILEAPLAALTSDSRFVEECFGAVALVVQYDEVDDVTAAIGLLQGALAASLWLSGHDDPDASTFVNALKRKVGRVIVNDWPTGVAFSWAQQHGGPWPATTDPRATSVGAAALDRFVRPVAYQGVPEHLLSPALQSLNPWQVPQRVNGHLLVPDE